MDNSRADLSQLIPPLPTNTQGVRRLLSAFRSGTTEIKGLLSQECNVILECRLCQSMFRSLPNFISHKRAYCLRPAPPLERIIHNNQLPEYYSNVESIENELGRRDIDQIASRLTKSATFAGSEGIRGENPEATQDAAFYTAIAESIKGRRSARIEQNTVLTPIPGTSKAVSQTVTLNSTDHVNGTVDEPPNKRLRSKRSDDKTSSVPAPGLNDKESTTPIKGEKKKEGNCTVMQYPCPLCKKVFSKPNGTYRHIREIHKKNNDQLERMKNNIRKKAFLVTVVKKAAGPLTSPSNNNNNSAPKPVQTPQMVQNSTQLSKSQKEEEKEWNDHTFTVDVGDHRCGYCGLKYERRAALLSHAKQCNKKSREAAKKPQFEKHMTSKPRGAANRKISAPMKIVRKYLMNGAKTDDDRNRLINGSNSLRRSTRAAVSSTIVSNQKEEVGKSDSAINMLPTISLKRLPINTGDQVKLSNSSPIKSQPPKSPITVPPLSSTIVLETIIKNQKSNASNILVRQVSDKSCLSPLKTSAPPVKEPPVVASITPMLSVKPKDGYPLNYFSPGSAETKLGGGSSVQSSIQIRRDYTKSSQSGDDSTDGSVTPAQVEKTDDSDGSSKPDNPVIEASGVPKSRPILSFDRAPDGNKEAKNTQIREMMASIFSQYKEEMDKVSDVDLANFTKKVTATSGKAELVKRAESSTSASKNVAKEPPIASQKQNKDEQTQSPSALLTQRLKNSTVVAVPVSMWNEMPNLVSSIKLKLPPDLLLTRGISKVVIKSNASVAETSRKKAEEAGKVDLVDKASTSNDDESTSASKSSTVTSKASSLVPGISKPVPAGVVPKRNSVEMGKVAVNVLRKPTANQAVPSSSKNQFVWKTPDPVPKKLVLHNIDVPTEDLPDEGLPFKGWSKEASSKSLAWFDSSTFFQYHDQFSEYVRRAEEYKFSIELEPSDQSMEFPPDVKIEYLDH